MGPFMPISNTLVHESGRGKGPFIFHANFCELAAAWLIMLFDAPLLSLDSGLCNNTNIANATEC